MNQKGVTNVLDICFLVLCFGGFLFQVFSVSEIYFSFPTTTLVTIAMPEELPPPDVSFCVRYVDILSSEFINQMTNGSEFDEVEHVPKIQNTITVSQIFEKTPSVDDMIGMCFLPRYESYNVMEGNASFCNNSFEIDKYYAQEYICYRFTIKNGNSSTYSYHNLAFSLAHPGLFYGVLLNPKKIVGADVCKVVIHEKETLPFGVMGYAPIFTRKVDNIEVYNFVKVGYSITEIDLLPPPFQTQCRWYSEYDNLRSLCIDDCLTRLTLETFGKVPFTSIQGEGINLKHVSNIDVLNETSSKLLDELDTRCNNNCSQPVCETEHYTTYLQKEETSEMEDFFTIMLQAPTLPTMNVTSGQKVPFADFLIYVTSCFGTWFAVSALTLSPRALAQLLSRRRPDRLCFCRFCHKNMHRLHREIRRIRRNRNSFRPD